MTQNPFSVGDIVHIKTGHAPREVTRIYRDHIYTRYTRPQDQNYPPLKPRHYSNFAHYEEPTPMPTPTPTSKLYEVIVPPSNPPLYGTYLATAANGHIVLDFKTHTASYDPQHLSEVVPHTVLIRAFNASVGKHYTVNLPTDLNPQDVILNLTNPANPEFAIVERLDTQYRKHAPTLDYKKVQFA